MPAVNVRVIVLGSGSVEILIGEAARRALVIIVGEVLRQRVERVELSPTPLVLRAEGNSPIQRLGGRFPDLNLSKSWNRTGACSRSGRANRIGAGVAQSVERSLRGVNRGRAQHRFRNVDVPV